MRAALERLSPWIAIAAVVAFHASFAERDRALFLDQRYYVHFAQRIADGAVPHRDLFDNKPELASVLAAPAVLAGDRLGIDRVRAVRLASVATAAATGLAAAALAATVHRSRLAAALAALAWTAAPLLGFQPSVGPVPKLWMTLLAIVSGLLAARRRWFAAGAVAAAAALDWQVGALAGIGVLAAAALERERPVRAAAAVAAGGVATTAVVAAALARAGALRPALEQTVLATLVRGSGSVARRGAEARLEQVASWMRESGAAPAWLAVAGLAGVLGTLLALGRLRGRPSLPALLPATVLGTGVLGLTLLDFQGYGDLFVVVAFLATFAGLAAGALERLLRRVEPRDGLGAAVLLAMLALAAHPWSPSPLALEERLWPAGVDLDVQRRVARELADLARGRTLGFAGCSEQLSLSGVPNAFSFPFWNRATWGNFRRDASEPSGKALLRIASERKVDGVVCAPDEASDELAAAGWTRRVLAAPPTRYQVDVFLRPDADPTADPAAAPSPR